MSTDVSESRSRHSRAAKVTASAKLQDDLSKYADLVKEIKSSKERGCKRGQEDISSEEGDVLEAEGSRGSAQDRSVARLEAEVNRHKRLLNEDHETIERLKKMVETVSKRTRCECPPRPEAGMRMGTLEAMVFCGAEVLQHLAREKERADFYRLAALNAYRLYLEACIPACSACQTHNSTLLMHKPSKESEPGHYMCHDCYIQLMRNSPREGPRCPICRADASKATMNLNLAAKIANDRGSAPPNILRPQWDNLTLAERKDLMRAYLDSNQGLRHLDQDIKDRLVNNYAINSYALDRDTALGSLSTVPQRFVHDEQEAVVVEDDYM